jgi:glyoxylase-like metal-dependent hydrolase (beta-lactamase superfamily II)
MMHPVSTSTLTIHDLGPHLIGFYDGRVPGKRLVSQEANWLDDGGYALGICSYAIYDGGEAIVYDTHLSPAHAEVIRSTLAVRGVRSFRVVLSHWHLDHVAGNCVFADCEVIAHKTTMAALTQHKAAIEAGACEGPPAIMPLVMPATAFDRDFTLKVGRLDIEFRHIDIHSHDGLVAFLPHDRTLLAGDTLEDTITYVAEPERLAIHLDELERMNSWSFARILPNHGSRERITGRGYDRGLIRATQRYVRALFEGVRDGTIYGRSLTGVMAEPIAAGWVDYFLPYEDVHRLNLAAVAKAMGAPAQPVL